MNKWYNWLSEPLSIVGIFLGADVAQTKEILGIILIILNIIIVIVTTTLKVIDWYKRAKADVKITKDEIEEVTQIVNDGIEDINKNLESKPEDKEEKK